MVVRESTGKFVTQRQIPKLCKVGPHALLRLLVMAPHPDTKGCCKQTLHLLLLHFDSLYYCWSAMVCALPMFLSCYAQVSVSLPPEALLGQAWGQLQPGAAMVLSAPGMPQLQVPLADPASNTHSSMRYACVAQHPSHFCAT